MESQIKEEIANRNPDYYFSAPIRTKMLFGSREKEDKIGAVAHEVKATGASIIKGLGYYDPNPQ